VIDIDLAEFLCAAIAQAANRDPAAIGAATPLLDLDLDSLTLVSVLSQIEAVYGIELEPEEIMSMLEASRIGDLAARIEAALAGRRG